MGFLDGFLLGLAGRHILDDHPPGRITAPTMVVVTTTETRCPSLWMSSVS
jgi:hypothetical protein